MTIPKKWAIPIDSYSKMIVWFLDGNIKIFYSLDWKSSHSLTRDRAIGIRRFQNKIDDYRSYAKKNKIYDSASDSLIAHYEFGQMFIYLY